MSRFENFDISNSAVKDRSHINIKYLPKGDIELNDLLSAYINCPAEDSGHRVYASLADDMSSVVYDTNKGFLADSVDFGEVQDKLLDCSEDIITLAKELWYPGDRFIPCLLECESYQEQLDRLDNLVRHTLGEAVHFFVYSICREPVDETNIKDDIDKFVSLVETPYLESWNRKYTQADNSFGHALVSEKCMMKVFRDYFCDCMTHEERIKAISVLAFEPDKTYSAMLCQIRNDIGTIADDFCRDYDLVKFDSKITFDCCKHEFDCICDTFISKGRNTNELDCFER